MTDAQVRAYLASIGAKGGKAGTGKAKSRGDSCHYQGLAKLPRKPRKPKREGA